MMRKLIVIVLFLIVTIIPFFFNYNNITKTEDIYSLIEDLETKTPVLLSKYDIPGAAISLIENGELKWIGTFGYEDIEEKIETDKNTVYQVASISKSVAALGILKLAEDGVINLDDPVEKYITRWQIPESTYDKSEVTIRRLLSHTSGLSRGGGYPGYEPLNELPSLEESLSGIGGGSQPVKGGVEGLQMRPAMAQEKMIEPMVKTIGNLVCEGSFNPTDIRRLARPIRFGKGIEILFKLFGQRLVNSFWDQQLKANDAYEKRFDRPYLFSTKFPFTEV